MTDDNKNINRPTNQAQFEHLETKHNFGLDKFPEIPTEVLLVSLRDIVNNMYPPSHSQQSDYEYLSLKCWALDIIALVGMRIDD